MDNSEVESIIKTDSKRFKAVLLFNLMSDWNPKDTDVNDVSIKRMRRGLMEQGYEVVLAPVRKDVSEYLHGLDPKEHVVFNWCEGLDGEPNAYEKIPPVLEEMGFAYTGADAWSLATTLDKGVTKDYLLRAGVSTPISKVFTSADADGWDRFPALVKPVIEHCSHGITPDAVVDSVEQLEERVQYVLDTWNQPALVEDFIDGPEFNVSLWGNGRLYMLPLAMLDFSGFADYHERIVSYDAKWDPNTEAFRLNPVVCPAPVDDELRCRIEQTAKAAYKALHLRDYGRIDIRVRNGVPYVLDVNSNPDITLEGGFARSARTAGYDYSQTVARILHLASKRIPVSAN